MTSTTLLLLAFGFVLLVTLTPLLTRFLCRVWQLEKPNFAGTVIPAATGITFWIVGTVVYAALPATGATLGAAYAPAFLLVCAGFGFLGLLDDKYGSRTVGGFRGHIGALIKGKPTTGAFKMVGGGLVALCAAFLVFRTDWLSVAVTAPLIALGANALNLLDTRPARAQFGFALFFGLPVLAGTVFALYQLRFDPSGFLPDDVRNFTPPGVLLAPVIFAAATEWWHDARGKAMMGDTGSNLLGATGALAAAVTLPVWGSAVLLAVLIFLNIAAERVSLNTVIEQNRFLRWVDAGLGVRGSGLR